MRLNVHQAHIESQAPCAWGAIGYLRVRGDTLCMGRKSLRPTFIRQWRQHRGKTLVQIAEQLHMTHGQLSRIERGLQPYNQELLEKLAELYRCDVVDLLIRNPAEPESIWSIWDRARPGERQQITNVAGALVRNRTGTDG
jgi:transcriptional regulator with XRE-family HTH domain